jgi:hypothetical protein
MSRHKMNDHDLSQRHFRQIICRPMALRNNLLPIWGVTWRPGDHRNSFHCCLYRPLGTALMMTQISCSREQNRERIGLFGIAAQIVPQTATVSYEELRLFHDFSRRPFVGGRGPVLDPSEERPGGRGNGSWVRLALEVDHIRRRVAASSYRLPVVPQLPDIYFGFGRKEAARFELSEELHCRAASSLQAAWNGSVLHDLRDLDAEIKEAQNRAFAALPNDQQQSKLREAWDAAFIPPTDPSNGTGLWLLPHSLTTDVYRAARIFEYFGKLVGANVFNPARELCGKSIPNPAASLAKESGFDLLSDLGVLAETAEGSPEYSQIEERLINLVPVLRERTCASAAISDQDLLNAICQPELPLVIEPPLNGLPEDEQIRLMRSRLNPHISECCLDSDIIEAARNPHGPLLAAGLCRVQALHRSIHVPLAEAMTFSPTLLGRSRMQAVCWFDKFDKRSGPDIQAHPATPEMALAA